MTILLCKFHAAQLLTRGLLKEFNRLQRLENTSFIKECGAARKWSTQTDEGSRAPPPALSDAFCRRWAGFYTQVLTACGARGAAKFREKYRSLLRGMRRWDPGTTAWYESSLANKLPKEGFTAKGLARFKNEMKMKWRAELRRARQEREECKKEFAQAKYLLLKRPENLS